MTMNTFDFFIIRIYLINHSYNMKLCQTCQSKKAMIVRPKTQKLTCLDCFYLAVEEEVHYTIISNDLFKKGEKVALGASGGKDSTGTFQNQ